MLSSFLYFSVQKNTVQMYPGSVSGMYVRGIQMIIQLASLANFRSRTLSTHRILLRYLRKTHKPRTQIIYGHRTFWKKNIYVFLPYFLRLQQIRICNIQFTKNSFRKGHRPTFIGRLIGFLLDTTKIKNDKNKSNLNQS